jgi:pimeloyl-ACP methyl ester carboxylesterase
MPYHRRSFTFALTGIVRFLVLRDRILDLFGIGPRGGISNQPISRQSIPSGKNVLDAVFVDPAAGPARASILICHGIGETVGRWLPVQQLLAANGVASLVFDYSGYGRSTGRVDWIQCELDAEAAFRQLERLTSPLPIGILGFSLGSGPAAAIAKRVQADHLILGAAFTSFRDAAHTAGIPRALSALVPPSWSATESLRDCSVPVLILHGEKDRLFPVQMARELVACCPGKVELLVVPDLAHNQPFRKPELSYWGHIIARLLAEEPAHLSS